VFYFLPSEQAQCKICSISSWNRLWHPKKTGASKYCRYETVISPLHWVLDEVYLKKYVPMHSLLAESKSLEHHLQLKLSSGICSYRCLHGGVDLGGSSSIMVTFTWQFSRFFCTIFCLKPSHESASDSWLTLLQQIPKKYRLLWEFFSIIHPYSPESNFWKIK
jgi:hypothetical protein